MAEERLSKADFAKEIGILEKLFGSIDEGTIPTYFEFISTVPKEDLKKIIEYIIRTYDRNYFPKLAVFFRAKDKIRAKYHAV